MHAIRGLADRLIGLSAAIGTIGLLFEVVVILVDVVGRYFGSPLYGSQDLVTMGMAIVVFGGMAVCDRAGGHIAVDLFERYFPGAMNRVIDIVAALAGAVIFGFIAWVMIDAARLSSMLNMSTNLLRLPRDVFQYALAGFSTLTALGMLLRAVELAVLGRDVTKSGFGEPLLKEPEL